MEVSDMVARQAEVEVIFAEFGLSYTHECTFPVDAVTHGDAVQVREAQNRAPKDAVDQYARQMEHGALFPPIIVRQDTHEVIDGNTRLYAARKAGRQTVEAFIVDVPTEEIAVDLGAAVNQTGGLRLTSDEMYRVASRWIEAGKDPKSIARRLGCSETQARKWRLKKTTLDRAAKLGLDEVASKLPVSTLIKLAPVTLDKPFEALLKLAVDAKSPEKQTADIVRQIGEAGSEEDAIKIINEHREVLAPCGALPHKAARSQIPLLRAACATIMKLDGNPSSGFDPSKLEEELARWQSIVRVADAVVVAIKARS